MHISASVSLWCYQTRQAAKIIGANWELWASYVTTTSINTHTTESSQPLPTRISPNKSVPINSVDRPITVSTVSIPAVAIANHVSRAGVVTLGRQKVVRVVRLRRARRTIVRQQEAVAVLRTENVRLARLQVLAGGAAFDRRTRSVGHDLEVGSHTGPVVHHVAGVEGIAAVAEVGAEDVFGLAGVEESWAGEGRGGGGCRGFDLGGEGCGGSLHAGDGGVDVRAGDVVGDDGGGAGEGFVGDGSQEPVSYGFCGRTKGCVDCLGGEGGGFGA
jgi:hypothetical protein